MKRYVVQFEAPERETLTAVTRKGSHSFAEGDQRADSALQHPRALLGRVPSVRWRGAEPSARFAGIGATVSNDTRG